MTRRARKLSFQEIFVREFAGHPLRVAINIVLTAATGVLIDYYVLGAELTEHVVFGALVAPLIAILVAGVLKE